MVYTISISVWITSINANTVHHLVSSANDKDNILVKILTSRITELEKLQETRMQVVETTRIQ